MNSLCDPCYDLLMITTVMEGPGKKRFHFLSFHIGQDQKQAMTS
jgi:hypothetical protein